jgi:predicted transcriptional regulator
VKMELTAIRLKAEQVKRLGKIAKRVDRPVSWLIRRAIDDFLRRQK